GGPAQDERERARQVRFLQYRGFSLGQALGALKVLHQSS
ncbi:recombination regulator RecX, partial [Amnimonas aquatica]